MIDSEVIGPRWVNLLLLANVTATLAMVGVIWIIQVVHYPLFSRVGIESFRAYAVGHNQLITLVVLPLMFVEIGTAFLLALLPPSGTPTWLAWGAFGLVLLIWASTFFIQVPFHNALLVSYTDDAYRGLVLSNWLRTIAWTLRGCIVLWMLWQVMG
ncbi:MAG: hypothetical protein GYB68_14915 [Chloroflexi bacterium]|nr:hypothetical protein [Chloroflexota bacterium]